MKLYKKGCETCAMLPNGCSDKCPEKWCISYEFDDHNYYQDPETGEILDLAECDVNDYEEN